MAGGLFGGSNDADAYVHRIYIPGQPLNAGGVDDPKLTEMIRLQRRTFDVAKRRDILWDLQRYISQTDVLALRPLGERGGGVGAVREELRAEHRP